MNYFKCFINIISLIFTTILKEDYFNPYFTTEESEADKFKTCPALHNYSCKCIELLYTHDLNNVTPEYIL